MASRPTKDDVRELARALGLPLPANETIGRLWRRCLERARELTVAHQHAEARLQTFDAVVQCLPSPNYGGRCVRCQREPGAPVPCPGWEAGMGARIDARRARLEGVHTCKSPTCPLCVRKAEAAVAERPSNDVIRRPCGELEHVNDLDNPGFCLWCKQPMLSRCRECRTQPEHVEHVKRLLDDARAFDRAIDGKSR